MKKILFSLLLLIGAIGANAQTMKVYKDGEAVSSIARVDSVKFSRHTTKAYKAGAEIYSITDADSVSFMETPAVAGMGKFSISAGKQVAFAQGNLRYTRSTDTWSFAEHQYDMIHTANVSDSVFSDTIDLFGWSTTNTATPFGVSTSQQDSNYIGDFVDWGVNKIGDDAPYTWRTLTIEEWHYLLSERADADSLIGVARINLNDSSEYVNGLIILPDGWTCPDGITFKSGFTDEYEVQAYADYQTFILSDWQKMEAAGALFLAAAGYRYGLNIDNVGYMGIYWSASPRYTPEQADNLCFFPTAVYAATNYNRNSGRSVRLVKDL